MVPSDMIRLALYEAMIKPMIGSYFTSANALVYEFEKGERALRILNDLGSVLAEGYLAGPSFYEDKSIPAAKVLAFLQSLCKFEGVSALAQLLLSHAKKNPRRRPAPKDRKNKKKKK